MLKVRYHAHHLELSGYGRAASGYITAITEMYDPDVELEVLPIENPPSTLSLVDVAIYHTTPGRLANVQRSPAHKHVALTTWETESMPAEYVATLKSFDATIMPSDFSRGLVREEREDMSLGPIYVVPHGFCPDFWEPSTERAPNDVFTFYSIGAWGERKNTLGLLKAYLHAFRRVDRTRLVLIVEKVNMPAILSVLARSLIPRDELPGLLIPDHRLSDREILDLHSIGACFVTATRSEGFGLPIFEAAIMGKPIITPLWGGQAEFLIGYKGTRSVWHAMTPVFPGEDSVSVDGGVMRLETALPTGANCGQLWAEPSLDRLAQNMRMVLADFREGILKDDHSRRPYFEKHYGFDAIGARFVNTLKEILR